MEGPLSGKRDEVVADFSLTSDWDSMAGESGVSKEIFW
jgi:hypothetical protein